MFAYGYPTAHIAFCAGVSRRTVLSWGKALGYSRAGDGRGNTSTINRVFRRIQRMPRKDREVLFRMLQEKGITA